MFKVLFRIIVSIGVLLLAACAGQQPIVVQQQLLPEVDNRYDSEFPVRSISKQLDFVSNTVKKLDCIAFYMSYFFERDNTLDENNLTAKEIKNQSVASTVTNESVTGTATIIYYDGQDVGLLTCAHVIDFSDTIIIRYDNGQGPIQILSVKVRQQNYVKDLPEGEPVKVVASNSKDDIAFLSKKLDEHVDRLQVLNYPLGNTKDLEWGSIVYVMGFPLGNKMVTQAIVSNPGRSSKTRFLTDALYNRGISGSPVLAIRDGVPNLEWVGIASSAAAQSVYYTKPGKEEPEFINPDAVFNGDLFVDHKKMINYGVTFNVSIEAVTGFLNKNKKSIEEAGVVFSLLFK